MLTPLSASVRIDACGCSSGLSRRRCCGFDHTYEPSEEVRAQVVCVAEAADRAFAAGQLDEADQLALCALNLNPRLVGLRVMLAGIRRTQGNLVAAQALYERAIEQDPNLLGATQELALVLYLRGDLDAAEGHARMAVRLGPLDARSHNIMGMILTDQLHPLAGEYHYRKVLELVPDPVPTVIANLAWNLKNQGRVEEARDLYQRASMGERVELKTLLGWAKMEEEARDFDAATELLQRAEQVAPNDPMTRLFRAVTEGRKGNIVEAISILDSLEHDGGVFGADELIEKGKLLDRLGLYSDAFKAFEEGKRALRLRSGNGYLDQEVTTLFSRLKGFFTADRMAMLPRATVREDSPQPIFIVGFPRSGTTMIEQTLTAHPEVSAGDELPMINALPKQIPQILGSPLPYPEALSELWLGDMRDGLDSVRDLYLRGARQRGATEPGKAWFTDKMPLNETHLGLITLTFPHAPIVHMLRHPLDVVLSVHSNLLTHGFNCGYALETAAIHYARVADLIDHYRAVLPLKYLAVRYEDVVDDQENQVRALLDFVGLPFHQGCLSFHENRRYARTASYAQVTEKLHDRSRYRYRHYRRQLEPVIPILQPVIERLGYTVD